MTFVSYAQNLEDVVLWRALKDVDNGFYVDVGAGSPDEYSVTKAFYEKGWSGINIEPLQELHDELQNKRVHDINLRLALGAVHGTAEMNFIHNSGLSTLDDKIAQKHSQAGWALEKKLVDVRTLEEVWEQHVPTSGNVHFLKIDVEGFEDQVIRGNNWKCCRPWIVVVESTLPMTQTDSHQSWEPVLKAAGYRFAYADGLNRFYVAKEHKDLLPSFKYPPNVFDEFTRVELVEATDKGAGLEAKLAAEQDNRQNLEAKLACELEQREKWQSELAAHRETAVRLEAKLAAERERREEIEKELVGEREQREKLQSELAAHFETSNHLEAKLASEPKHSGQLEQQLQVERARIHDLEHSLSWKITAPLRLGFNIVKSLISMPIMLLRVLVRAVIACLRWPVVKAMKFVLAHPKLDSLFCSFISKWPWLNSKLKELAQAQGLLCADSEKQKIELMPETKATSFQVNFAAAKPRSEMGGVVNREPDRHDKTILQFYAIEEEVFSAIMKATKKWKSIPRGDI